MAEQAGLGLTWSQSPNICQNTGFLVTKLNSYISGTRGLHSSNSIITKGNFLEISRAEIQLLLYHGRLILSTEFVAHKADCVHGLGH